MGTASRLLLSLLLAGACASAGAAESSTMLMDLSLEQLRDVVVTTVSRHEERLDRAAASAYVITGDDIRRSGATTLPEALRLAPTLDVARADGNQYAISARGFNNVLANKLLVLIDGRTVYTPLFSGVFWEAQDVLLDDVDRIEVVTGPSTALWGSNAVNGLIHVITRNAAATPGWLLSADVGSREKGANVRYGTSFGGGGSLRVYAKAYDRKTTRRADGNAIDDAGDGVQTGFRADWQGERQTLTLQGDALQGSIDQGASPARKFSGVNVLGRWERSFGDGHDASVQVYAERTHRNHPQIFEEALRTVDAVGQYGFSPFAGHRLLFGAGIRHADDDVTNFVALAFLPASRRLTWTHAFAQDQVALAPELELTLAASVEHNPYTGTEWLPSARLAWRPADAGTAWVALSRAVRAPSRIDREFFQPAQPPYVVAGGPDFESEVSRVVEVGWRAQPLPALSYAVTLYQHDHDQLRSLAPTPQGLQFRNDIAGRSRGVEAWARWRVVERWRLDAGYTWLQQKLHVRDGAVDVGGLAALGNDPRRRWLLRSSFDITPRYAWDVSVRHVGARPNPDVPSYTAVDTRMAVDLGRGAELSLTAQNLFDPKHPEWGAATNRIEVERSVLLQLRWRL